MDFYRSSHLMLKPLNWFSENIIYYYPCNCPKDDSFRFAIGLLLRNLAVLYALSNQKNKQTETADRHMELYTKD